VRRYLGCTPTELVNRLRLAHAAARIADGDEAIAAIALDCGIANLGYFYRLFTRAYGLPPAAWRRRARRITGG